MLSQMALFHLLLRLIFHCMQVHILYPIIYQKTLVASMSCPPWIMLLKASECILSWSTITIFFILSSSHGWMFPVLWGRHPEEGLLDHLVILLIIWQNLILFSTVPCLFPLQSKAQWKCLPILQTFAGGWGFAAGKGRRRANDLSP